MENLKNEQIIIFSSFPRTSQKLDVKLIFDNNIQVLKLCHQYLHKTDQGKRFWHLNGHRKQQKKQ